MEVVRPCRNASSHHPCITHASPMHQPGTIHAPPHHPCITHHPACIPHASLIYSSRHSGRGQRAWDSALRKVIDGCDEAERVRPLHAIVG